MPTIHPIHRVGLAIAAILLAILAPAAGAFENLPAGYDQSEVEPEQLAAIEELIASSHERLGKLKELFSDTTRTPEDVQYEFGQICRDMRSDITAHESSIFAVYGGAEEPGPPPSLARWWQDGKALWVWLEDPGREAALEHLRLLKYLRWVEEDRVTTAEFLEAYHKIAGVIERQLSIAESAESVETRQRALSTLARRLIDADKLQSFTRSHLQDFRGWNSSRSGAGGPVHAAAMLLAWQIDSGTHPVFGAAKEEWIEAANETLEEYTAASKKIVAAYEPLLKDEILCTDDYKYMKCWKHQEISSNLRAAMERLRDR